MCKISDNVIPVKGSFNPHGSQPPGVTTPRLRAAALKAVKGISLAPVCFRRRISYYQSQQEGARERSGIPIYSIKPV